MDDSHAAAQLHALSETTPDVLVTIDAGSHVQFVNQAIEEVLGYRPADLLGEPLTEIMPPELADRHQAAVDRYLSTGTRSIDWTGIELPGQHRDGHQVPLSISFSEFTLEGDRYFTGILRDVSARRRWADKLERLTEFGADVLDVESVDAVCAAAIATAEEVLDIRLVEIALYDPEDAALVPAGRTAAVAQLPDGESLFGSDRGLPWQVFVDDEERSFDESYSEPDLDAEETPLGSAILVPLGVHGVLTAGGVEPGAVSGTDRRLVRLLASTVAAVLDRLDRERTLRSRTAELSAKQEEYERVRRLNDVIRDITEVLLTASSREEIKQVVCDRLATSAPYRFVWFGEHDPATDAVRPVAWAGVEKGYLDSVEVTADRSETGQGPVGRAVRSGTTRIRNDLQSDPPFEPWRQEAIKRDYRAGIAVPVTYRETTYGVVTLYASEPDVFTEREATVLTELGEMVGYGLNAMERHDALVAETAVELEFVVRDADHPLFNVLRDHEGNFRLESIGPSRDTTRRAFVTFEGVPLGRIESLSDRIGDGAFTVVRDHEEEVVVEATIPRDSVIATLLDRGAVPTEFRGTGDAAYVTIRISKSASVREFVELFEARFDGVELLARRESSDPVRTTEAFERAYTERLTERQEEVLRTAYFAGFFEQPRESTARDVADVLGVSQPTVSRHIRAGEKSLFELLFEDL